MRALPAALVPAALVTAALVTVLAGCSAGAEPAPVPSELDAVETVADLSHEHREGALSYEQDPPVGGAHNPRWLACAAYDQPVPNEFAVHSMEHGGIWVTYAPELPAQEVERLEALTALDEQYVLVSPYDGLPAPIVVSSWGLQLQVESADDPRLEQFVQTYAGGDQGGEPGVPCRDGGLTPDQARGALGG